MNIKIMNRYNAIRASFEEVHTAIISITDCDSPIPEFPLDCYILKLRFDDVDEGGRNCITHQDAINIVGFVRDMINKGFHKLIVHCEAGISRSSGVAAAIMRAIDGDDWAVFNNPKYCPNMACYRKVLDAFGEVTFEEELNLRKQVNKAVLQQQYAKYENELGGLFEWPKTTGGLQ